MHVDHACCPCYSAYNSYIAKHPMEVIKGGTSLYKTPYQSTYCQRLMKSGGI
jgi:hypothetical protein